MGLIEQSYSKLEMICTKRRNKLLVDNIRNEFFSEFSFNFTAFYSRVYQGSKSCRCGKKVPSILARVLLSLRSYCLLCSDVAYAIIVVINNILMYFSFIHIRFNNIVIRNNSRSFLLHIKYDQYSVLI